MVRGAGRFKRVSPKLLENIFKVFLLMWFKILNDVWRVMTLKGMDKDICIKWDEIERKYRQRWGE